MFKTELVVQAGAAHRDVVVVDDAVVIDIESDSHDGSIRHDELAAAQTADDLFLRDGSTNADLPAVSDAIHSDEVSRLPHNVQLARTVGLDRRSRLLRYLGT